MFDESERAQPLPPGRCHVNDASHRVTSLAILGRWLTRLSPSAGFTIALAWVSAVAIGDYLSGYEVRFAVLQLLPIALGTWTGGRRSGAVIALAAAACWSMSFATANPYSREVYFYWEGTVMVLSFLVFVFLIDRLRSALERADARFLRVLEELYAGVYVVADHTGKVLYANQRLAQMIHADPLPLHAADFERRFAAAGAAGERGETLPQRGNGDVFVSTEVHDADQGRWYLVQSGPIPWIDTQQVTLKVITDITARKRAQMLEQQHQEALHQNARLVALGEIASALSHELNQPLMAVASYNDACLRLLADPKHDPAEVRRAMLKCREQAVRAGQIITRLREFMRRRDPVPACFDLNDAVREALRLAELELARAGVTVDLQLAVPPPAVCADRVLVLQVITNLVSNALEAMARMDPARRRLALVTALDGENATRVSVRDQGHGMTDAVAASLYTPFFTTKADGLGLGLSICRSVVEAHGGRLWHEARSGAGCTFHFTLPSTAA
ncbi:MAG TPA: ATP-binding protein [Burkholderiaceae bacterium]|nr:ATP-binding protein [Burkholderiaceae bacterium]